MPQDQAERLLRVLPAHLVRRLRSQDRREQRARRAQKVIQETREQLDQLALTAPPDPPAGRVLPAHKDRLVRLAHWAVLARRDPKA